MKFVLNWLFLLLVVSLSTALSDVEIVNVINNAATTWKAKTYLKKGGVMQLDETNLPKELNNYPLKKYNNTNLPESFDARDAWPLCDTISTIQNQGSCGSCWAFSTTTAMTDRLCISSNVKFNFSVEALVDCCESCWPVSGCSGGWKHEAWKYWVNEGLPSQDCKPYTRSTNTSSPQCEKTCKSDYSKTWEQDLKFGEILYTLPSMEDVMNDIIANGPVVFSFQVYDDFYYYESGVYKHLVGNYKGGHAVKVIGWGVENSVPYWLIANSWGPDWGDHGFFKIIRGENNCNIDSNTNLVVALP